MEVRVRKIFYATDFAERHTLYILSSLTVLPCKAVSSLNEVKMLLIKYYSPRLHLPRSRRVLRGVEGLFIVDLI